MAEIKQQLSIVADPAQPVREIVEIIGRLIGFHPGKEVEILEAVQKDIADSIPLIKAKYEPAAAAAKAVES